MTDLEHQDVDRHFIGQLFGPIGTGKTTLGAGLCQAISQTGRILYIDGKDGWVSLDNSPSLKTGMTHIKYKSYDDLAGLSDAIKRKAPGFEDFDTVMLDEFDSMYEDVLDQVLRERLGTKKGDIPREVPDWTDYRPTGELLRKVIEAFIDGEVNVLIVTHDKEKTDHRKVTTIRPNVSPVLNDMLQRLMHVTGYVTAEVKPGTGKNSGQLVYTRQVQAQPTALIAAKTRIGGLRKGVKLSFGDFVDIIADWVSPDGTMAEELADPAGDPNLELPEDELPTEGIDLPEDVPDEAPDDEPDYQG